MKKGFTLIELLAVIVILAIIAIIAAPIILNIINDSRESSDKRSVELYGKAIEQGLAAYYINRPYGNLTGTGYTSATLLSQNAGLSINYDGERVECTKINIYEEGTIYLEGCTVGGRSVNYTYGTEKIEKYEYLWLQGGRIDGPSIGTVYEHSMFEISELPYQNYIRYKLDDENKVTNSYACAIFDSQEYCVEGGSSSYYGWNTDEAHSTKNVKVLYDIQSANIAGVSCSFSSSESYCSGTVTLRAKNSGAVSSESSAGGMCESDNGSYCDSD